MSRPVILALFLMVLGMAGCSTAPSCHPVAAFGWAEGGGIPSLTLERWMIRCSTPLK